MISNVKLLWQAIEFNYYDALLPIILHRILYYIIQYELIFAPVHFEVKIQAVISGYENLYFESIYVQIEWIDNFFDIFDWLFPFTNFFNEFVLFDFHPLNLVLVVIPH